jgi:hypothetical protein
MEVKMNKKIYMISAFILFLSEIAILLFWKKNLFIRGYIGDVLAVIFLYTLIKSVVNIKVLYGAALSFLVGVLLEIGQYYNFAEKINMQNNKIFTVIFGAHFDWKDILAYFIGGAIVIAVEKTITIKNKNYHKK